MYVLILDTNKVHLPKPSHVQLTSRRRHRARSVIIPVIVGKHKSTLHINYVYYSEFVPSQLNPIPEYIIS